MSQADNLAALATNVNSSGVLQPASGGTGLTSPGSNGNVLTSNGTAWVSSTPGTYSQWTTTGSNIYYNTGNVGIGTTSPANRLSVNSGASTTIAQFTSTGSSAFLGMSNSGSSAFIGADNTGAFLVQTPGSSYSTKLLVDSVGNVGIGTSSPVGRLNVYGASGGRYLTLDAPTNGGYATFQAGGTAFADMGSYLGITGSGNATDFFLTTRNYPLIFGSNSTERMRITSAGLVQILSSSTNTTFTGSGELALKNSTSNPYISWHNTAGDRYGYAQASVNSLNIQSESGFLSLGGSSGEAMRITTTGNVSIGTTSNNARLDVRAAIGNIYVNSTTGTNQVFLQTANTGGDFYFGIDNSTGGNFNTNTAYAGAIWRSGTNPICFINNSTERMRIDSSGNVGIGTTSPDNNAGYTALSISGSTGAQIYWRSTGSSVSAYAGADSNGGYIATLSNHALLFRTNNTTRAGITTGGDFQFNSGYGSVATAYGCRAWVNFAGSSGSINSSGGVSSVTRNGTGNYNVNFSFTMPDTSYAVTAIVGNSGGTYGRTCSVITDHNSARSTTTVNLNTYAYQQQANVDYASVQVSVFR